MLARYFLTDMSCWRDSCKHVGRAVLLAGSEKIFCPTRPPYFEMRGDWHQLPLTCRPLLRETLVQDSSFGDSRISQSLPWSLLRREASEPNAEVTQKDLLCRDRAQSIAVREQMDFVTTSALVEPLVVPGEGLWSPAPAARSRHRGRRCRRWLSNSATGGGPGFPLPLLWPAVPPLLALAPRWVQPEPCALARCSWWRRRRRLLFLRCFFLFRLPLATGLLLQSQETRLHSTHRKARKPKAAKPPPQQSRALVLSRA